MKRVSPLILALLTAAAGAQSYPGEDVSVDYSATGSKVLLYPGGKYGRVVHTLRQPGEFTGPVKLHKPGKHAAKPKTEQAPQSARRTEPAPLRRETQPPPPPKRVASLPPPPQIRSTPQTPTEYGDLVVAKPAAPRPAPVAKPKPETRPAPSPEPTDGAGTRHASVGFESDASDPSSSAVQNIGRIADNLNGVLTRGSARVQLLAYAGPKGEKSSNARRLSLKRALIVRQLLIDSGVPSDRIDVRAMGGATDSGAADRVDVYVKG